MRLRARVRVKTRFFGVLIGVCAASAVAEPHLLMLETTPQSVALAVASQKVVFASKEPGAPLELTTYVKKGGDWEPFFDAGLPLLRGPSFDLAPTAYEVVTDTPKQKEVVLRGRNLAPPYDYDIRVAATHGNPLIKFTITCRLPEGLPLDGMEPVAALWMSKKEVGLAVDQGPDSIYGDRGIPHGFGFPAAYLWDEGKESAVFFDMTPMTWFSPGGVYRFHDIRIRSQAVNDNLGMGMHLKKVSGSRIPPGDMVTVFYLHSAPREVKPAKLEAIGHMLEAFAPLHPGVSEFPEIHLDKGEVSWAYFARRAIEDLMKPELAAEIEAPWTDAPLPLVAPQEKLLVHAGSRSDPGAPFGWDFSTVNNHLSAWILYARLHPDERMRAHTLAKRDSLPRFYDPQAGIIRYGTREPARLGDVDMSWQNFFFHFEMLRVYDALAPEDFNPAVAGRLLMAADGLIELAHNVDYVFPQWWNPYSKQPAIQQDLPELGIVREPWQVGTYAYIMMRAFEITGGDNYLREAQNAVRTLLTTMEFSVSNVIYTRAYTDPADFPVAELFGNAYGVVAARKIAEATGDTAFLDYSRDFLHTLLRLTFWYEDSTDPVSRDLRNAGLFYPHGGAHVATPWENSEAYVGIVEALRSDPDTPLRELLLKLCNLNRINAFYFYPAVYTPVVQALDPQRQKDIGQYFPIEPFYSLEGSGGHTGPTAAYMASLGIWNYWLYEALAEADDPGVMVLNTTVLENFEEALQAERAFIVYNPTETPRGFTLRVKHLPGGNYHSTSRDAAGAETNSEAPSAELEAGFNLTLGPREHRRITFSHEHAAARIKGIHAARHARNTLSHTYARLQQAAAADRTGHLSVSEAHFHQAMQHYTAKDYTTAAQHAARILKHLDSHPTKPNQE